jgi:hypothetical protein
VPCQDLNSPRSGPGKGPYRRLEESQFWVSLNRSIEPALEAICLGAMERLPQHRHASALDLGGEIESSLAEPALWGNKFGCSTRPEARSAVFVSSAREASSAAAASSPAQTLRRKSTNVAATSPELAEAGPPSVVAINLLTWVGARPDAPRRHNLHRKMRAWIGSRSRVTSPLESAPTIKPHPLRVRDTLVPCEGGSCQGPPARTKAARWSGCWQGDGVGPAPSTLDSPDRNRGHFLSPPSGDRNSARGGDAQARWPWAIAKSSAIRRHGVPEPCAAA